MKKRIFCLLLMVMIALPMAGIAGLDLSSFEAFKQQALKGKLHFPETSYAKWENRSNNQLAFQCQLKNNGDARTVAYELYVYTEDIWGERLLDEDEVYTYTVRKKLNPDAVGYTEFILLPDRKDIYKVYVGIKKVKYEDDRIEEFSMPTYYNWTIK